MSENPRAYWFKRRRYGWGWFPVSWQGWLVVTVYLAVVLAGSAAFADAPKETAGRERGIYVFILATTTVSLIRVAYAKGPKPRWRWGKRPTDNPHEDF